MTKMNETFSVNFIKSDEDENMYITYKPASGLLYSRRTEFDDLLDKVKENSQPCLGMMGDEFERCFADRISKDVAKGKKNNARLKTYRDLMATRLKNYTCYDDSLSTSLPLRSTVFNIENASYKSATVLIHDLIDNVSKNGCLLLNVGPMPNGEIPEATFEFFL